MFVHQCNKWCHLFCALWIPEVGIANIITKTPIINIDKIASHRKNKNCSICNNMKGKNKKLNKKKIGNKSNNNNNNYVCIKCEYHECDQYVHPMCTTKTRQKGELLIHENKILNENNNNIRSIFMVFFMFQTLFR